MGKFPVLPPIPLLQLDLGADVKMSGTPLIIERHSSSQHREDWDVTDRCHSEWNPRRKRVKRYPTNDFWSLAKQCG